MIRSFTFQCLGCSSKLVIGTEQFEHFSTYPVVCSTCKEIFSTPSQKLFWIAENLKRLWFNLPKQGITIERAATQLERSIFPLKVKTIPFRLRHRPERYYLRFDEDDTPYFEAGVTLIFDQEPPFQVSLRDYQHGPEPGWQALPEIAHWTRRLNQEIYEQKSTRIVEIGFYAPSAIHRKRQ